MAVILSAIIISVLVVGSVASSIVDSTKSIDVEQFETMDCDEIKEAMRAEVSNYQLSALAQDRAGMEKYLSISKIHNEMCQ